MSFPKERVEAAKRNGNLLFDYIKASGEEIVQVSAKEYSLKSHDSMRINFQKGVWKRYSTDESGDCIQYLISQYGMKFKEAVETLTPNWTIESIYNRSVDYAVSKKTYSVEKATPTGKESDCYELVPKYAPRTIAYLTSTRKISDSTVFKYLNKGMLAQDTKGNAVFRILDDKGNWKGAEIVGTSTYKRFKRATPETGYGWTITVGQPKKLCFFESAIDTMSFYEIYKDKIKDMALVSLAGVTKEQTLEETIKRYQDKYNINGRNIVLCVDNDEAGTNFIEKWKAKYDCSSFRTKSPYKDWNELLVALKEQNRQVQPSESKQIETVQRKIQQNQHKVQNNELEH